MAQMRYFAEDGEQLTSPWNMDNKAFDAQFGAAPSRKADSFSRWVAYRADNRTVAPVVRAIVFKSNPSLHKCDARCVNAKGKNCECSCGGKNHGAGNG